MYRRPLHPTLLPTLLLCLACSSNIAVRRRAKEDWFAEAQRSILTSTDVSEFTYNILRRRALLENHKQDPLHAIEELQEELRETHDRGLAVAIAELGYLQAKRWTKLERRALSTTIRYAYAYLFDPRLEPAPEQFDAQFRRALDLYHRAFADLIRANKRVEQEDERVRTFEWYGGRSLLRIGRNEMAWGLDQYDELHVANDFRVDGLPPPDSRRGLGVPCILRRDWNREAALQGLEADRFRFLPPKLAFAATAVVRYPDGTSILDAEQPDLLIEVLDPTKTVSVEIEGLRVPIEIDYVTPIATLLSGQSQRVGISALLRGEKYARKGGLYMFQPYQKDKIFVLLVHGLASDPLTWIYFYTDLLANETIRTRYQFAFWFYPTGQPVMYSASQLRKALLDAQELLEGSAPGPAAQHTVVCGHSMGGILARALVVDSGTHLWDTAFDRPPGELDLPVDERAIVEDALIFEPVPSVTRAIFFATPHRGSPSAKTGLADWASGLLSLPNRVLNPSHARAQARPEFRSLRRLTSVQSLRDDNPVLLALADLPISPGVTYHSIIGDREAAGRKGGTDGFVPYSSSHLQGAASERIIHSGHSVQRTPEATRETRRILLEHIAALDAAGK